MAHIKSSRLIFALILINILDVIIHVATDQIEPIRITSNLLVITGALVFLTKPQLQSSVTLMIMGAAYLMLNVVFIALNGIGAVGVALISITTILIMLLAKSSNKKAH